MTTREFIQKTFDTKNERWGRYGYDRRCSSVVTDKDGTVYSYGPHYPLLFKVAGHTFINDAGYSNTTAKHIGWAWQAVDYNATAVQLDREAARVVSNSWASDDDKLAQLLRVTAQAVADATEACNAKKRKDTKVYRGLLDDLGRAQASHIAVSNVIEDRR